jgi:hypothetical protein
MRKHLYASSLRDDRIHSRQGSVMAHYGDGGETLAQAARRSTARRQKFFWEQMRAHWHFTSRAQPAESGGKDGVGKTIE